MLINIRGKSSNGPAIFLNGSFQRQADFFDCVLDYVSDCFGCLLMHISKIVL